VAREKGWNFQGTSSSFPSFLATFPSNYFFFPSPSNFVFAVLAKAVVHSQEWIPRVLQRRNSIVSFFSSLVLLSWLTLAYLPISQKSELLGLIDMEECTRVESAEAKVVTLLSDFF